MLVSSDDDDDNNNNNNNNDNNDQISQLSGLPLCFIFGRSQVQIGPSVLTEFFVVFLNLSRQMSR
jgi:hypothetical protein